MIKKIKTTLLTLVAVFGLSLAFTVPALAACDPAAGESGIQSGLSEGVCETDPTNYNDSVNAEDKVGEMIRMVINIFSIVVGVVAVIMIIIGGLKYITSSGDSGNVSSAKNTILYAIIGLVIVALAQLIVRFVLDRVTA